MRSSHPLGLSALAAALLLAAAPGSAAAGAAPATEARYQRLAVTFHVLAADGGASGDDWAGLADRFEDLHRKRPGGERSPDALYSAALAWQRGLTTTGTAASF